MHPMCADREADLPDVFMGYYLFYAEMTDEEGLKPRPTYFKDPRGDVKVFADYYRRMEKTLAQASEAVDRAEVSVPPRLRVMFLSEATPIRFFYRTARTHANFYESCILRDRLNELANKSQLTQQEDNEAAQLYDRWLAVLRDEKENTEAALPLMKLDVRLDPYYGSDHSFSHGVDMIEAKLDILQGEIENYLPSVKKRLGMGD
ncbi:MAG: hypothetical protein KC931_23630, partial [Candidatus Omnitrophica bacterium]|nr:hypothetical protein [Candidatus Omnitrophota bacterium]